MVHKPKGQRKEADHYDGAPFKVQVILDPSVCVWLTDRPPRGSEPLLHSARADRFAREDRRRPVLHCRLHHKAQDPRPGWTCFVDVIFGLFDYINTGKEDMKRGRGGGSNKKSANKKPRMRQTASTKGARQTAARSANQKSTRNGANNGAAGRKTALSRKKNHREEDQGQLKWNDEDLVEFRAVPRVSVNDPDVSSILRQNRESGTPVVLTGAVGWTEFARPWLKLSDDEMNDDDSGEQPLDLSLPYKLDIDGMIKDIGDEKVRVISKGSDELNRTDGTTTVRQFLQSSWPGAPGRKSKQKKYLHQWQFPTSDTAAAKLCHKNLVPQNVFGDDLFELAAGDDDIPYQYLFMGPVNTQSTNHCDRGGMDISIAPILGEKEVILTHRDHGSMLYQLSVDFDKIDLATYPLLAHAQIWKTTIKPGMSEEQVYKRAVLAVTWNAVC